MASIPAVNTDSLRSSCFRLASLGTRACQGVAARPLDPLPKSVRGAATQLPSPRVCPRGADRGELARTCGVLEWCCARTLKYSTRAWRTARAQPAVGHGVRCSGGDRGWAAVGRSGLVLTGVRDDCGQLSVVKSHYPTANLMVLGTQRGVPEALCWRLREPSMATRKPLRCALDRTGPPRWVDDSHQRAEHRPQKAVSLRPSPFVPAPQGIYDATWGRYEGDCAATKAATGVADCTGTPRCVHDAHRRAERRPQEAVTLRPTSSQGLPLGALTPRVEPRNRLSNRREHPRTDGTGVFYRCGGRPSGCRQRCSGRSRRHGCQRDRAGMAERDLHGSRIEIIVLLCQLDDLGPDAVEVLSESVVERAGGRS